MGNGWLLLRKLLAIAKASASVESLVTYLSDGCVVLRRLGRSC